MIREVVPWEESRSIFYWRLRRRLLELRATERIHKSYSLGGTQTKMKHAQANEMLRQWFIQERGDNQRFLWEQDKSVVQWLEEQQEKQQSSSVVAENLKSLSRDAAVRQFKGLLDANPDLLHEVGMHVVQRMPATKRAEFLECARTMTRGGTPDSEGAEQEAEQDSKKETKEEEYDSSENGLDSS